MMSQAALLNQEVLPSFLPIIFSSFLSSYNPSLLIILPSYKSSFL
jgi:hypothetical protein